MCSDGQACWLGDVEPSRVADSVLVLCFPGHSGQLIDMKTTKMSILKSHRFSLSLHVRQLPPRSSRQFESTPTKSSPCFPRTYPRHPTSTSATSFSSVFLPPPALCSTLVASLVSSCSAASFPARPRVRSGRSSSTSPHPRGALNSPSGPTWASLRSPIRSSLLLS
jgi:hypothetical protein